MLWGGARYHGGIAVVDTDNSTRAAAFVGEQRPVPHHQALLYLPFAERHGQQRCAEVLAAFGVIDTITTMADAVAGSTSYTI